MINQLSKFKTVLLRGFFTNSPEDRQDQRFKTVYLILLFILGIFIWHEFLEIGANFNANHDWPEIYSRWMAWKSSLSEGTIPYHVFPPIQGHDETRLLALTNYEFTPQLLLLLFLTPKDFMLVNTLLLYSVGYMGCLLIRKQFNLSLFSFTAFFLIMNFNGSLVAHIAAGHYEWISLLLMPFVILFLARINSPEGKPKDIYWLSLVFLVMLLQGGVHPFIFCLILMGLFIAFNLKVKEHISVLLLSIGLGAIRFGPAALIYMERGQYLGFSGLRQLIESMIFIRPITYELSDFGVNYGYWENSYYVGIPGALFILLFGAVVYLRTKKFNPEERFRALLLPLFAFTTLSFTNIWQNLIANIPIEFLSSARLPTRFVIVPLLFLLLFACVNFDLFLQSSKPNQRTKLYYLALLLFGGLFLGLNAKIWRLYEVGQIGVRAVDSGALYNVVRFADPEYLRVLNLSALVTLATLSFVIFALVRSRGKPETAA